MKSINNYQHDSVVFKGRVAQLDLAYFFKCVSKIVNYLNLKQIKSACINVEDPFLFSCAFFSLIHLNIKAVFLQNFSEEKVSLYKDQFDCVLSEMTLNQILKNSLECELNEIIINEHCDLVFQTSGSSGRAKIVKKKFHHLLMEIHCLRETFQIPPNILFVSTVSHQHIYGFLFRILLPFINKNAIYLNNIKYPEDLEIIEEPYILITSPLFLKRIEQLGHGFNINLAQYIFSSGGFLDHSTAEKIFDIFQKYPIEVLGSTETGGIGFRSQDKKNILWTKFKDVEVSVEESDLLKVKSTYFNEPYILTGDCARLINSNQFELLGRSDDIVKVEEKRVSMIELSHSITNISGVKESYVLALSENGRQKTACVVVLTAEGREELLKIGKIAFVKKIKAQLIKSYDAIVVPKKYRFVDRLPYNEQSKLSKLDLQRLFNGPEEA